ncbi:MAG: hypothetical protein HKN68_14815 [Saprospiraceae bacterium]|nr:hypothetical protein [Saprospiraceae bacterium]
MKSFIISMMCIACFLAFTTSSLKGPEDHPEFKSVHEAVSNYVNGLYMVDTTLIEASVHPELRKRGYWYNSNAGAYRDNLDMSFNQLRSLAGKWNLDGKQANEKTIKKIEIYDINSKTATARLTAAWGLDYFHLAKLDDKWMIMNVLWQSLPEEESK